MILLAAATATKGSERLIAVALQLRRRRGASDENLCLFLQTGRIRRGDAQLSREDTRDDMLPILSRPSSNRF